MDVYNIKVPTKKSLIPISNSGLKNPCILYGINK